MKYERRNRAFWDADADDYQAVHGKALGAAPRAWGIWRIPDDELGVLGDLEGRDVLEYGCGAGQWSIALAQTGARAVGLDFSGAQLAFARVAASSAGVEVAFVLASGERAPFASASFDVVFCDHGALSFCAPERTVPEAARLLRTDGVLAFSQCSPWVSVTYDDRRMRPTRRLRRSYFGMRKQSSPDGTVDFQLPYGEWIRLFRAHGLVVDDLVELRPPAHAATTFTDLGRTRHARRWPTEHIWVAHKA
jgi:SAM-dependent methyltransferase